MKIIIHISDLHVSLFLNEDGEPLDKLESYLSTNSNTDESFFYIDTFISTIEKFKIAYYPNSELILLITGDIANEGEELEYKSAYSFVKKIMEKLNIPPNNCLIIPGDHDVNRRSIRNELKINPRKDSYLLNEIKFNYFSKFYKEIKGNEFEFNKIIFDHINIDDKLVLIGINSNYEINQNGGEGFVVVQDFQKELDEFKKNFNDQTEYICCWHHNMTANFEDKNSGQWDKKNRTYLITELLAQNIKLILTGNEHTLGAKKVGLDINTSDSGVFSNISFMCGFKMYPVFIDDKSIKLKNIGYSLHKDNNNDCPFYWNPIDNKQAKQVEEFVIFEKNNEQIDIIYDIPETFASSSIVSNLPRIYEKKDFIEYENIDNSERLYQIIREKKLFHSGHFHWSETSRAHNWIDISKLLENKDDLLFVKNAIIEVIQGNNLANDCDLMIGLGYEGNLIASKASIKYNLPYSYLPYSYRYKDHHDYENKLNLSNEEDKFKKVIIITDVVNDGRTIRKLIGKREKNFFSKVDKVIVISLLYTGAEDIVKTNILNSSVVENFDQDLDEIVENIEFYTIKSIKVDKCPYGKNYAEECLIYRDDLSCVNLFYDNNNK